MSAVECIRRWRADPVAFVREVFEAEPDAWQVQALRAQDARLALKACKGPGKSSVLAWRGWNFLATRPHSNTLALSITEDNLKDNLWKEFAVWYARPKAAWLREAFELGAERIFAREAPKTWWISARAFAKDARPEQQANTLAGLHAKSVAIILDEVSDYPDGVLAAAEGIFSTADTEAHLWVAGNPTRSEGPLYSICTRERERWKIIEITGDPDDPNRSPRIDADNAREQIALWGRDNPWVQTNILGVFPRVQADKLLGPDDITRAEQRDAQRIVWTKAPVIWGLDCARFGDDFSVLQKRQGPIAWRATRFAHTDGPTLANKVSAIIRRDMEGEYGRTPDHIFVDVTGIGSSPYDHLKLLGWQWVTPVDFGSSADEERFADKRAEMYHRCARWVQTEGCIPSGSNALGSQLCAPHITWRKRGNRTCFVLESKEEMRKRGLASPDDADALALTFYVETPVRREWAQGRQENGLPLAYAGGASKCRTEYDPYERRT